MLTLSDAAKAGRYRLRAITLHNVLEARAVPAWLDAFDLAFVRTPSCCRAPDTTVPSSFLTAS
jgi:hypothetical protein